MSMRSWNCWIRFATTLSRQPSYDGRLPKPRQPQPENTDAQQSNLKDGGLTVRDIGKALDIYISYQRVHQLIASH